MQIAHGEGKRHVCDVCGYAASNEAYLRTHKRRMHSAGGDPRREKRRFECRYCDYHHWMKVVRDEHEKGQHLHLKDQGCNSIDTLNFACKTGPQIGPCSGPKSVLGHFKFRRLKTSNMTS